MILSTAQTRTLEVNGDTIRAKAWLTSGSEPGWGTTLTPAPGTNIVFDHAGFINRITGNLNDYEQWSIGIDTDAPALV